MSQSNAIRFRYFEAPESEMNDLVDVAVTCDICERLDRCFLLHDRQRGPAEGPWREYGCVQCLQAGRFGYFHLTEVGMVDETGLSQDEDEAREMRVFYDTPGQGLSAVPTRLPPPAPPLVSEESITTLFRTPTFPTWQACAWLVHCNDFMVYLGTWEPHDFQRHAPDGDGRALFLRMTDGQRQDLWPDGETFPDGWMVTYYAFRCLHCEQLRGTYDFT